MTDIKSRQITASLISPFSPPYTLRENFSVRSSKFRSPPLDLAISFLQLFNLVLKQKPVEGYIAAESFADYNTAS
ncbi:MAG: hypothetical protein ACI9W7_001203 [Porticoccaceae bacterium]